jgi:hypothetical protein
MTSAALTVVEEGRQLSYTFDDLMAYHGGGFPGGVAHGFKVMQRALPLLCPEGAPERREIRVRTSFTGPGARDAFEIVTRALTEERYVVDPDLARPERGRTLERYVFELSYRERAVTLIIRDGIVRDEFIELARMENRTAEQDARLEILKQDMADRLLARSASEAYDVAEAT